MVVLGWHDESAVLPRSARNGAGPARVTYRTGWVGDAQNDDITSIGPVTARVDVALHAVVMEAYVHGVSIRKVDDLVAARPTASRAIGQASDGDIGLLEVRRAVAEDAGHRGGVRCPSAGSFTVHVDAVEDTAWAGGPA